MAYIDGAGTSRLGGLRGTGWGVIGDQVTAPYSPADGSHYPGLSVYLRAVVSTTGTNDSDIQWEVATDDTFTNVVWSQTTLGHGDGLTQFLAGPLAEDMPHFWRTRSAAAGTTGWGAWSETWSFTPDVQAGHAYGYTTLNVGIDPVLVPHVAEYVDLNQGVEITLESLAVDYVNLNHGVEITRRPEGIDYGYLGDVNTDQPLPHIWFIRPTSGRPGNGIEVVGLGFGDLQTTFDGRLEHRPGAAWEALPVVDWQTYLPTPDAYTEARELDPILGHIDMQHTVIAFTIPAGALPPGWPLRVVTQEE